MNFSFGSNSRAYLESMTRQRPDATARLQGDPEHRGIHGTAAFYQLPAGVLVRAELYGLPQQPGTCQQPVFGFHIHQGKSCTGNREDPFADTGSHFNPEGCPHPQHAGDLPPLFSNQGYAFQAFLTDRFTVEEVLGRTIVIHDHPDDFTSQPAGNSGRKIACGIIQR